MQLLESVIYSIPADGRDDWLKVGSALKTELGDLGFPVWDAWSRTAENYDGRSIKGQWKSLKVGKVTAGSIYFLARKYGFDGEIPDPPLADKLHQSCRSAIRLQEEQAQHRAKQAALHAQTILDEARVDYHPYLASKGFSAAKGLVNQEKLIVPVRDRQGKLMSLQRISKDGNKRFLSGSRVRGGSNRIGRGRDRWIVEGYATGLSVYHALLELYRPASVVVAFSAGNIPVIARKGDVVLSDHDKRTKQNPEHGGAGAAAARKSGCRWMMPLYEETDFNDYMLKHGPDGLRDVIRKFIAGVEK